MIIIAKKKLAKKRKPTKRSPAKKKPVKKAPKKPVKRTPTKRAPAKKERRKGVIGSAIGKIPGKVKIKGGKAKSRYKTKQGTIKVESEYKDLEVG